MNLDSKIYVAGHTGLVGSAIFRLLKQEGYKNIITRTSEELDLRVQQAVTDFFASEKPEFVFLAAAKVGGINANNIYRADFIANNIMIQTNVINASYKSGVTKLLFLGSSCIYPRDCPQPMKEEHLLTSPLEKTNEPYAIAKIAGIKMCEAFNSQHATNYITCMPTNLYGQNDNFDLQNAHVLPALIRKFIEAKHDNKPTVEIWGTGIPKREFLHVDDLARAVLVLMQKHNGSEIVNVGCGEDISIRDLAMMIRKVVGYDGEIVFNSTKPDGTLRKWLDISKIIAYGWKPEISLEEGIRRTVEWYKENKKEK
jgi:GDP-L-fucose synthase